MPNRSLLDLIDDLERDLIVLRTKVKQDDPIELAEVDNMRLLLAKMRQRLERDTTRIPRMGRPTPTGELERPGTDDDTKPGE